MVSEYTDECGRGMEGMMKEVLCKTRDGNEMMKSFHQRLDIMHELINRAMEKAKDDDKELRAELIALLKEQYMLKADVESALVEVQHDWQLKINNMEQAQKIVDDRWKTRIDMAKLLLPWALAAGGLIALLDKAGLVHIG